MVVANAFMFESARLCILDIALTNFGSPDSLLFRTNTEGVEVVAAEALPRTALRSSGVEINAMLALRWRTRPPILRLVCRSEKMSAALAISNFETTSLAHAVAAMDAHRLLALADILRSTNSGDMAAHAHVLEQIRKLARREFFLNWLPSAEDRFVCLVMQAGIQDPGSLCIHRLTNGANAGGRLLPVSHSVRDNHVVIMYDFNGVEDPRMPVEVAAIIQEKLHHWCLRPRSEAMGTPAETEHLMRLSARWTDNVCETLAMARSCLLADLRYAAPKVPSTGLRSSVRSVLIVTDVVDMFGLTLVMATAENWKKYFDRIYLLLPSWRGRPISPAIDPLALIEDFGGSEVLEPITAGEFDALLRSLEPGMSVSFASAAAPYSLHIDDGGVTELPVVTFELSSSEELLFFWKLANYATGAGGPLVWRELQCAFAGSPKQGIPTPLVSDNHIPSLADDLYAVPCSSLGWPLRAFQHFDRHMLMMLRSGDLE